MIISSGTQVKLSVITCSHNPRESYLRRVLDALSAQTQPKTDWELILVDNASTLPLAERFDLSWHPDARHVREAELGLTPARLRGISEAKADVIVFVDDDNVLSEMYIAEAMAIGERYPFLGAWGAGTITPEFESPPPRWAMPHLPWLALREVSTILWSNEVWMATPLGAGLCVRRFVAERYRDELSMDATRVQFDRRGGSLEGGGDFDLVYTSRRFDLGWGIFPSLRLLHLMPSVRTTKKYLLKIAEATSFSIVLLNDKAGCAAPPRPGKLKLLARAALILARQGWFSVMFFAAQQRGFDRGHRQVAQLAEKK